MLRGPRGQLASPHLVESRCGYPTVGGGYPTVGANKQAWQDSHKTSLALLHSLPLRETLLPLLHAVPSFPRGPEKRFPYVFI